MPSQRNPEILNIDVETPKRMRLSYAVEKKL